MRWNSLSKLTLRDLKLNFTHGPPNQGRHSLPGMMTHILRKRIHKEKGANTRVTGAWRHRNVFRCCTGYLAMNLFVPLHSMDRTLHFHKSNSPNPKVPPDWWRRRIICEWNNDNAADEAYRVVIRASNIKPNKIKTFGHRELNRAAEQDTTMTSVAHCRSITPTKSRDMQLSYIHPFY
jgi:hypothetical protein